MKLSDLLIKTNAILDTSLYKWDIQKDRKDDMSDYIKTWTSSNTTDVSGVFDKIPGTGTAKPSNIYFEDGWSQFQKAMYDYNTTWIKIESTFLNNYKYPITLNKNVKII